MANNSLETGEHIGFRGLHQISAYLHDLVSGTNYNIGIEADISSLFNNE